MKKIKLTQGEYAIVDDEDYHYLSRFKWWISNQKRGDKEYKTVIRNIQKRVVPMTHFIISSDIKKIIHKNKDFLDHRKENLATVNDDLIVNRADKYYYRKGVFSSKYKGVCHRPDSRGKKWQARIGFDGKRIYIGSYDTEDEAGIAYNEKAKELYGELAYQNKI